MIPESVSEAFFFGGGRVTKGSGAKRNLVEIHPENMDDNSAQAEIEMAT